MKARSDDEITGEIIAAFGASPYVKETNIIVETHDGKVILSGVVDTLEEKEIAGEIAQSIKGVKAVENDITVSSDGEHPDIEIEKELSEKFASEPDLISVGARSYHGTVVLMGKVPSLAVKKHAIEIAESVRGVREVISDIHIAPGKPIDDVTIANDVAETISDDPRLTVLNLDVQSHDGVVRIYGEVTNEKQRDLAKEIASAVPGVQQVENHLIIKKAEEEYSYE
ncbi:MAG: BON domain-containing protein [Armatimonadetes bacterium]|nr:BON domain-containing protein [Armatimonadota bacterium]